MDNQIQTPDYSFILNKPTPEAKKPKHSKKLVALGVIGVVFVLVIVVSLFIPKDYSTQASQTSLSYFQYIGQKQYDNAYALLDTKGQDQKSRMTNTVGPLLQKTFDNSKCAVKGTTKDKQVYSTTVSCPFANSGATQSFVLQTTRENGTMKITSFATVQKATKT